MKALLTTSLFVLFTISSFAQKPLEYSFNLPFEIQKKRNFEKTTTAWLQQQNLQITKVENDTIWATGNISFNNTVVYQASKTYNRIYREQSNGQIVFKMKLYMKDHHVEANLNQFKHRPKMKFDNLDFGVITDNPKAPQNVVAMTDEAYSADVWNLLKQKINNYTNQIKGGTNNMVLAE